jgi:hypothetical protein
MSSAGVKGAAPTRDSIQELQAVLQSLEASVTQEVRDMQQTAKSTRTLWDRLNSSSSTQRVSALSDGSAAAVLTQK